MGQQKDNFLESLDQFDQRYSQIDEEMAKSATAGNSAQLVALSKEQGKLRDIVTKYREYKTMSSEIADAEQIIGDADADEDFRALAVEEKQQLEANNPAYRTIRMIGMVKARVAGPNTVDGQSAVFSVAACG